MRALALAILLGSLVSGCARRPSAQPVEVDTPAPCRDEVPAGAPRNIKPVASWPVPDFRFEDQRGQPFGLDDLLGKVWIADFIFIRCAGPCSAMTEGMKALQETTRNLTDLHLVTFTVDPRRDTVADLARHAKERGADPERWHFLRGDHEETGRLQADGFKIGDPDEPANHSVRFILVDRDGTIRRYYDGREKDERSQMLEDAKTLLAGEPLT